MKWDGELHKDSFGSYLKSLRLRKGMSQATVANAFGVTPQFISAAECNLYAMSEWIPRYVDVLELSKDEERTLYELSIERKKNNRQTYLKLRYGLDCQIRTENLSAYAGSLRICHGYHQTEISKLSGVPYSRIRQLEQGRARDLTDSETAALASVLCQTDDEKVLFFSLAEDWRNGTDIVSQGNYIKLLRLRAQMTQAELADRCDLGIHVISRMECGRACQKDDFEAVSKALKLSDKEKDKLFTLASFSEN